MTAQSQSAAPSRGAW